MLVHEKLIAGGRHSETSNKEKSMNKAIGIALVAAGIVLIIFGINAADSVGSSFSRFFTGNPTDRAIWLLVGGVVSLVTGGVIAMRPAR